jgi:hypothetical protein
MMGEELNSADITDAGVLGDRALALLDAETGKVASAKNPKKWSNLFAFRAAYVEPPRAGRELPAVRITFPDGTLLSSDDGHIHQALSDAVGRKVRLGRPAAKPVLEEYWLDIEGQAHRDAVTDEAMLEATFFDAATIHVLSTNTIDVLRAAYPQGRFEVRRFRPNFVVQLRESGGFPENGWPGQVLAIGSEVRLNVTKPCGRCVMITLAQGDLPQDAGILKTAASQNKAEVGTYTSVSKSGCVRRGDSVALVQAGATAA